MPYNALLVFFHSRSLNLYRNKIELFCLNTFFSFKAGKRENDRKNRITRKIVSNYFKRRFPSKYSKTDSKQQKTVCIQTTGNILMYIVILTFIFQQCLVAMKWLKVYIIVRSINQ